MTNRHEPPWVAEERRNARIRQLREQREAPLRRRRAFEPIVILAWFLGVAALVGILIYLGFLLLLSPRLMAWIEDNPGTISHGVVRDFVEWYAPGALADEPVSDSTERINFVVDPGDSATEIGEKLEAAGLVRSQLAFQYAVQQAGREGTLASGSYDLSPSLRPSQIVGALQQVQLEEVRITIGEGWRLEEIVGYLESQTLTMDLEEFASLVQNPPADLVAQYPFLQDLPPGRSLEGYLSPNTYDVYLSATARDIVEVLLDGTAQVLTPEVLEQIAARQIGGRQMTVDDVVKIASIVEREAVLDEERGLIAGVYTNRLNQPQGETAGLLNADPTLQYGLATDTHLRSPGPVPFTEWDEVTWWPMLEVRGADVVFTNAPEELAGYQTYINAGLPPTPIAAPRHASLQATIAPDTEARYLYFVAGCPDGERDGSHYFATTNDEHNANVARAREECAEA